MLFCFWFWLVCFFCCSLQSDTHVVASFIPHLVLFNPIFPSLMFFSVLLLLPISWDCITQLLAESQVTRPFAGMEAHNYFTCGLRPQALPQTADLGKYTFTSPELDLLQLTKNVCQGFCQGLLSVYAFMKDLGLICFKKVHIYQCPNSIFS